MLTALRRRLRSPDARALITDLGQGRGFEGHESAHLILETGRRPEFRASGATPVLARKHRLVELQGEAVLGDLGVVTTVSCSAAQNPRPDPVEDFILFGDRPATEVIRQMPG